MRIPVKQPAPNSIAPCWRLRHVAEVVVPGNRRRGRPGAGGSGLKNSRQKAASDLSWWPRICWRWAFTDRAAAWIASRSAACTPQRCGGLPYPRVELVGREIRAVRLHPLACLGPETMDADRTQYTRPNDVVPVVGIINGVSATGDVGVLAQPCLSGLHQLTHDRVQCHQAIDNFAGCPIGHKDVVDYLAFKLRGVGEISEGVNVLAELRKPIDCPFTVYTVTVSGATVT